MTTKELQTKLSNLGYILVVDGDFGPASKNALLKCLTDGLDTKLSSSDVLEAAAYLGVESAKIWTVWDVEASASPFINGRPTILFEPHRFSKATNHKYDLSCPDISSKSWNKKLYPKTQDARWGQLLKAVGLNIDAGLASASYGGFQILGENYKVCGYSNVWDFVYAQSRTEKDQLLAFVKFVEGNNLKKALQTGNWAAFAKGYNGSAYKENKYDEKLAKAYNLRIK